MGTPSRQAFDEAASLYDQVRPGYADELVDALVAYAAPPPGGRVLEIGCGTGQMTVPLAARGLAIVALEPGPALAALAARNCAAYPAVRIVESTLEAWPAPAAAFDLAVSAQAFHWIAPGPGCALVARALRPGGAVALVWYVDVSHDTAFWRSTAPIYDAYFPPRPAGQGAPSLAERAETYRQALRAGGAFTDLGELRRAWTRTYDGADYLTLLQTFSDHRALPPADLARFLGEIAGVIERHGGTVTREYETIALLGRRA